MHIVSLNGKLIEAAQALVPVDERGFRFGDGVFETIAVHGGKAYLAEYHLERMKHGLQALAIAYDSAALADILPRVIEANRMEKGILRAYVSRGVGSVGYLPATPAPVPTVLVQPMLMPPGAEAPVSLWLSTWEKISPRALPTAAKLAQGLNSTLARMEARTQNCWDALQLDAEGYVCEAGSANIFWVKSGVLHTPSLHGGALAGVTRRRLMELAGDVQEGVFTLGHLRDADAVFLTQSTSGLVPVNRLMPQGYTWDSAAATAVYSRLREQDIAQHIS